MSAADFSLDSGHDLWRVVHRAGGLRQEIAEARRTARKIVQSGKMRLKILEAEKMKRGIQYSDRK